MFSIATTPARQSVSETITVLSGRLNSAVLLEDRRAAILGLRSFAKDFPASVSSGALRCLIGSLTKDGDDVDTVKVILETLLLLFNPNENSPEASDEVLLWLADEFTQRQENITLLLEFVECGDFYSRLYSLQLLSAILSARTERTEECILTAPLGISRLVATLEDKREAVRDECIALLISLTPGSRELQKLVAFENAFERVFAIITIDGSLSNGGRIVEDSLILLSNLLRRNASNQSLFRESGCTTTLASLLDDFLKSESPDIGLASWAQTQRDRNIYAFLAVIRLFFNPGSVGVSINQDIFWMHGLVYNTLQLAFSRAVGQNAIKAKALTTCGDMIRGSKRLQESFAQFMVPAPLVTDDIAEGAPVEAQAKTYVIDGLLDLTLNSCDPLLFDLRYSACECLKAYFSNHSEVRLHFLSRAIDGYASGADESANILTVLLRPESSKFARDPYCRWFASVIAFHLLHENPDAKTLLLGLTEGDASKDEEVVTSIQTITAHLISGVSRGDDVRVLAGYLMLLLGWTFEDFDAVNDFLAEGSNVQSLIQAILQPSVSGGDIVQGLCALLLGVAYEFSTKDSPLPRSNLHSILIKRVDRDQYLDCLTRLRIHPLIRDFEATSRTRSYGGNGLPYVLFDGAFVNFIKDNYSRIERAIDRPPELEISIVTNGIQKGISRELVDSLRRQVEDKQCSLEEMRHKIVSLEDALRHRDVAHQRSMDELMMELAKLKTAYQNAEHTHQGKIQKLLQLQAATESEQKRQAALSQAQIASKESKIQNNLIEAKNAALSEIERVQSQAEAERADLKASIHRLEADLMKVSKNKNLEVQALQEENKKILALEATRRKEVEARAERLEEHLQKMTVKVNKEHTKANTAENKLAQELAAKRTVQAELDDLLIVFGDLEEKVARYKVRLRELGQDVSDGEDNSNGEEEEKC